MSAARFLARGVVVPPGLCSRVAWVLERSIASARADGLTVDADYVDLSKALNEEGLRHRRQISANGSAEIVVTEMPPGSFIMELSTDATADRLRVSPRRVRQMVEAGTLTGRKAGRSWLIDLTSVERLEKDRK